MNTLESLIISITEGLTEFLPISSTAHMRIAEKGLGISDQDAFSKIYTISIQLGAILSVVVLYWKKFFNLTQWRFYLKLMIAVVPSLILGYLLNEQIDRLLESPITIACIMLLGGIFFLFVDKLFKNHQIEKEIQINNVTALKIGLFQCLAILLPGLSRSAATIIGGMSLKMKRSLAAEFSFLLAVPTMFAATLYTLFIKKWEIASNAHETGFNIIMSSQQNINSFLIGNIVAFLVAILAIRFFIAFLKKYGFRFWGFYRIAVGSLILILIAAGYL
jgi:undecaprenyl-diphosphatase